MTQGIFILGARPKSKKEIKDYLDRFYNETEEAHIRAARAPGDKPPLPPTLFGIVIEATSLFGNEYDGSLHNAPTNKTFTFVGPDPYTSRKFYGRIIYNANKERWVVS